MKTNFHINLGANEQRAAGLSEPQPLAMADQVRFSELDMLGHVNNAVYMEWFERLRIRYTQEWGISGYDGGQDDPRIVIHSGTIRYLQELLMDDVYICTARCTAFRKTSYSISQQLWSGGTLRATFDCVLVNLMPDGSGKQPLSAAVRARFVEIDGAAPE